MDLIEKFKFLIGSYKKYPGDASLRKYEKEMVTELLNLTVQLPLNTPLRARIRFLELDLAELPVCEICKNNLATWQGNWRVCSGKCKIKATCLERYGVISPFHSNEIQSKVKKTLDNLWLLNSKDIINKRKSTCLEKYGVSNPSQVEKFKNSRIQTNLNEYGVENAMQCQEIKNRLKTTMLKLYGVENAMQCQEIKNSLVKTSLVRYKVKYPMQCQEIKNRLVKTSLARYNVRWPSMANKVKEKVKLANLTRYGGINYNSYSTEILSKLTSIDFWYEEYKKNQKSVLQISNELGINNSNCLYYFHKYSTLKLREVTFSSSGELETIKFLDFLLINLQLQYKIERKSLDIYIPSKNLAFEYNGIYWHSEEYRDSNYHLEKTLLCEKHGIRLVHIWEDDWLFKESLMKRKIKALLGLEERKVFARKCKVVVPSQEQKRKFYQENHIKGDGAGSISYALEFQEELVAMITFKNMGFGIWDLNRFATSCSVPGGFSKLLENFKKIYDWKRIYTFADRSWSQGNVYIKTGFKLIEEQPPTFYGLEAYQRKNRLNYTHERLANRFPDLKGTHFQIMDQAGIKRIWDCGQLKFELYNKN